MVIAAVSVGFPPGLLPSAAAGTTPILVTIVSSANPVEVGIPFVLTADTSPSVVSLLYNWSDNLGDASVDPTWRLEVGVAGNLTITLQVSNLLGALGQATLRVLVRPPLLVNVSSAGSQVDAGIPTEFSVRITGGVGPFTSAWTPTDGAPNGTATWPVPGNYSEPVTFWTIGPGWIDVRVADAVGGFDAGDRFVAEVVSPGALELATNGSVAESGWPIGVAVSVSAGTPPFQWSLSSSVPFAGDSPAFGTFPSDGMYRWNVSFAWPGTANLTLSSVDASGAPRSVSAEIVVEPPLAIGMLTPVAGRSGPFGVSANVSGGLPPYQGQFLLSDGEATNETLAATGSVATTFDPSKPGNYSLELRVTDALGRSSESSESVRILATQDATPLPVSSNLAVEGGIGLLFVVLLGAGLYFHWRRRREAEATASTEPLTLPVVRRLMQQSQIIDRETLVMLGEEAGESPEAVQAAIAGLIRTGEVSSEPGPGQDEVLRWRDRGAEEPPPRGGP